jgi:hypothetical protein
MNSTNKKRSLVDTFGINTSPTLRDPAKYEPVPFITAQPNLTPELLEFLHKNRAKKGDFFEWFVERGDHVVAGTPLGRFHLKGHVLQPLEPAIYLPFPCVIRETNNILSSEMLFSYQRLLPVAYAQKHGPLALSLSDETKQAALKEKSHPEQVYRDVVEAIRILKDSENRRSLESLVLGPKTVPVKSYIEKQYGQMLPTLIPVEPA